MMILEHDISLGRWDERYLTNNLPMYRVSPQLFVTSEHIMSDRASTSVSESFCGSGEALVVRGVD